ncbi:MAG: cell division protein ZapE, partial [Alphaproteobacteria bacterium]
MTQPPDPAPTRILAAYQALVDAGELRPDDDQRAAAARLDRLAAALADYPPVPSAAVHVRRWRLAALFNWAGKDARPPRGVYLWGGVGRGKSMLMDLFFAHAPLRAKRRVHFHAFMLDVHEAMHAFRNMSPSEKIAYGAAAGQHDPIVPVARQIALSASLLCFDELHVSDVADAGILGRLFAALVERGVIVVATSNRPPGDLYKDGLNRSIILPFIALIEREWDVLGLNG